MKNRPASACCSIKASQHEAGRPVQSRQLHQQRRGGGLCRSGTVKLMEPQIFPFTAAAALVVVEERTAVVLATTGGCRPARHPGDRRRPIAASASAARRGLKLTQIRRSAASAPDGVVSRTAGFPCVSAPDGRGVDFLMSISNLVVHRTTLPESKGNFSVTCRRGGADRAQPLSPAHSRIIPGEAGKNT